MQTLSIDFKIDDVESTKYIIFYHNIIKFWQFFIKHKEFKQDQIYSSIYQYASNSLLDLNNKDNDKKIYREINTRDQQQNTQFLMTKNSIDNITIILILITSDKTQLSIIASNLAFQPIYLIINILNYKTKR